MMGGAFLFFEGALVLRVLRSGIDPLDNGRSRHYMRAATVVALLSATCTITNIVPALLLLMPAVAAAGHVRIRGGRFGIAFLGVAILAILLLIRTPVLVLLKHESGAMTVISVASIARSFLGLTIQQFGIPDLRTYTADHLRPDLVRILPVRSASVISVLGFLAWIAALCQWWHVRTRGTADRAFLVWAGLALGSLLLLHSVYASREAYLFSAHAWPIFVLSTQMFLLDGLGQARPIRMLLPCLVVVMSVVQSLLVMTRVFA